MWLSVFFQSRMMKEGHPSTVTTVRLEGGAWGGALASDSLGCSPGKYSREVVTEQGSSGFLSVLYTT